MTSPYLNQAQVHARFKQVGGPGMSEGMDSGGFCDPAVRQNRLKGPKNAASLHGCGGLMSNPTALHPRWKQPNGMTMRHPELAQLEQCLLRQGDTTIFQALALTNVKLHTTAVNLIDPQFNPFADP